MTATAAAEPHTSTRGRDRIVIATLLVATFVMILNETIMGVALPRLMADLGVGPVSANGSPRRSCSPWPWSSRPPVSCCSDFRRGSCTAWRWACSAPERCSATIAPGFWVLLLARIVQASGTAVMVPLLMTTILTLVPIDRRGVVMGNVSIVISVAPAIGPTISGVILQYLSWRFMFGLVFPIAVLALVSDCGP